MNLITHLQTQFQLPSYKKGNKILIKKSHRGKFTEYCDGKVTEECIDKGKKSKDPKIRKQATFAQNARKWKHQQGGVAATTNSLTDVQINGKALTQEELQKKQQDALTQYSQQQEQEQLKQFQHQQDVQNTYNKVSNATQQMGSAVSQYANEKLNKKAEQQVNDFKKNLEIEQDPIRKEIYDKLDKGLITLDQANKDLGLNLSWRARQGLLNQNSNYTNNKSMVRINQYNADQEALKNNPENINLGVINPNSIIDYIPINQKGKKLIKHPSTHNTKSILDDTGMIDEKTLKIKKHGL